MPSSYAAQLPRPADRRQPTLQAYRMLISYFSCDIKVKSISLAHVPPADVQPNKYATLLAWNTFSHMAHLILASNCASFESVSEQVVAFDIQQAPHRPLTALSSVRLQRGMHSYHHR